MKRILFPTDLSEHADIALPHAINLAALEGGELHLLHVMTLHGPTSELMDELTGEDKAREALDGLQTGESRVIRAVTRAVSPAPAILDYADVNDVDAIVMGCHGRRGFRRLMLGSVAEEVIRAGRWPVLTVRKSPDALQATSNYSRILAPVDFSTHTAKGVVAAADLARRFGARLDLLHVIDIPVLPEFYGPVMAPSLNLKQATDRASEKMKDLAESLGTDIDIHTDIRTGGAVAQILEAAEGTADLIVIPTHGYTGWDRMLMGSVAEGILRRAECPVFALRTAEE
ncbi:MAG: universal stress protein [Gemmatimonadota bacterium]|nr:universal stress protein [Gemmatimonadota bacterium]